MYLRSVSGSVGMQARRIYSGILSIAAAVLTLMPGVEAYAQSTNLPPVTVEKPKQKPAQRQVQGPNREPIRIPVNSNGCRAARAPGKPYFVEFRSRTAVSYGHTFVFYGRLGEGNRFASYKVAGLHPKGDDPQIYMQGMMVPVPSGEPAHPGAISMSNISPRASA